MFKPSIPYISLSNAHIQKIATYRSSHLLKPHNFENQRKNREAHFFQNPSDILHTWNHEMLAPALVLIGPGMHIGRFTVTTLRQTSVKHSLKKQTGRHSSDRGCVHFLFSFSFLGTLVMQTHPCGISLNQPLLPALSHQQCFQCDSSAMY